ncbi:Aste57867_2494 [Aphanomyces stellatus]|uniref:Aste57867_2494 protein n=1 Tax=Aphanomyces stellatus TaxID=120398 RepID=A0A485KBE6_9STRA|nr:hypothetical protein As57867_002487 [Aphanomyces stellatus]VFT79693.1 Aste57867_2494 [Aphanomyces stellatus]
MVDVEVAAPLPSSATHAPHARGMVRVFLQLEGLAVLVAALLAYYRLQGNWWVFLGGFFAGDILSLGYVFGPAVGCTIYNLSHTFVGPLVTVMIYLLLNDHVWLLHVAVIWVSHLGWERSLGYGLRYPDGFTSTHITVDQDPVEYVQRLLEKEPAQESDEGKAVVNTSAAQGTKNYNSITSV